MLLPWLQVRQLPAVEYVEEDGVFRTQVTWGLDRVDQRTLPLDNFFGPRGESVWSTTGADLAFC